MNERTLWGRLSEAAEKVLTTRLLSRAALCRPFVINSSAQSRDREGAGFRVFQQPLSACAPIFNRRSSGGLKIRRRLKACPTFTLMAIFATGVIHAQDPRQIIEEVQKRSRSNSQRYEGTLQVIGAENRIATKRWVFERLGSFGQSKAILRFTAPPEVKGVALLIINHPDRASDQWMWRPAIGREQRISLQDRSTRFFGTDFSFEDLEERDVNQFDYKLLPDENGQWKIESRPRKTSQYIYSYLWVNKDNCTITKAEMYSKAGLARVIDYRDFEQVHGIWTARTTEVLDVKRKSRTILKFEKLEYDVPLKDDLFTVEALRRES